MNWPHLIQSLVAAGLTQKQIASEVGCGQSTISDLLRGDAKDPRMSTGTALLSLAERVKAHQPEPTPQPAQGE